MSNYHVLEINKTEASSNLRSLQSLIKSKKIREIVEVQIIKMCFFLPFYVSKYTIDLCNDAII